MKHKLPLSVVVCCFFMLVCYQGRGEYSPDIPFMTERSTSPSFSDGSNLLDPDSRIAVTDLRDSKASSAVRLFLINATTGNEIMELEEGATINLAALPTDLLNIRADVSWASTQSVRFSLNSLVRLENVAPYCLFGDSNDGKFDSWTPAEGQYSLTATSYSSDGATGNEGPSVTIHFTVIREGPPPSVISLMLVNADNGTDIMPLNEGAVINLILMNAFLEIFMPCS